MTLELGSFDDVNDNSGNFEPLKEGDHPVTIVDTEIKDTKAGTGKYIQITYQTANNRKAWGRYNVMNSSEKAQNIGRAQYKGVNLACGFTNWCEDPQELIGSEVIITIKHRDYEGKTQVDVVNVKAPEHESSPTNEDQVPF
jgi:hypothetical protein